MAGMRIRKAEAQDVASIAAIYEEIIAAQETGDTFVGWVRGVYPTEATAQAALARGDLFVQEDGGRIVGAAVINQVQVDVYAGAPWRDNAQDEQVMVLHTLVISPKEKRRGYGSAFVAYYESYARGQGCPYLRMDTNERNLHARRLYQKLGYREIGVAPCVFNGIEGVNLVLLEKRLDGEN